MKTVQRSPKYPFISLPKAVERAQEFYAQEGRNKAPVEVAVRCWGYTAKSSGGQQTIAALKGYGLIEDMGSGKARTLRLSDIALRIILDSRPDSEERMHYIRTAALNPRLFSELWQEWQGESLPSEPNMKHKLLVEYKFPEKAAKEFIRIFTETVNFADLYHIGMHELSAEPDEEMYGDGIVIQPQPASARSKASASVTIAANPEAGMKQDVLSLDEGVAVLKWPANLSKTSAEDLEYWLQLALRRIKRAAATVSDPDEGL